MVDYAREYFSSHDNFGKGSATWVAWTCCHILKIRVSSLSLFWFFHRHPGLHFLTSLVAVT